MADPGGIAIRVKGGPAAPTRLRRVTELFRNRDWIQRVRSRTHALIGALACKLGKPECKG